jgi:hypothetical protein
MCVQGSDIVLKGLVMGNDWYMCSKESDIRCWKWYVCSRE